MSSLNAPKTSPGRSTRPSKTPSPKTASPGAPSPESPTEEIQADDNLSSDGDSAVGTNASSTDSISSSIFQFRQLNGRTYNAAKTSEYWAPNDEKQNEGLDLLHNALLMMTDNRLFLAPVTDPKRILDVGTGTGIWAIDVGDMFPGAEVVGTDLSPIQPAWVPPNVHFQIDDCTLEWTWPENYFDLIHIRALYGSIPSWHDLYSQAFSALAPGGYLHDLEMDVKIQTDHHTLPSDHIFNEWGSLYYKAGEAMGRTFAIACGHTMRDTMLAVGFVDVVEHKLKVPCHGWPRDPTLQQAGLLLYAMLEQSLEGFGMFAFTTYLGWTPEEVLVFTARMRAEVKKKSNCGWIETTVVYGRKPDE